MKLSKIKGLRTLLFSAVFLFTFSLVQAETAFQVDGGTISTTDATTFCTADSNADIVNVTVTDSEGPYSVYVITDGNGNVLKTQSSTTFDFTNTPAGVCNVYHIAFKAFIFPPIPGTNVNRLVGWYGLSNALVVTRTSDCDPSNEGEDTCDVAGGTLSGGPFSFCAGDGQADNINADQIVLAGNSGANSQWVITDSDGNILGLPPTFSVVDFDGAGLGTCLVWHLSFEDGLTGAAVGENASNLGGCYSLSNAIAVDRIESGGPCGPTGNDNTADNTNDAEPVGDACGVNSGTIELATGGTNINVCTTDGVDDSFKVDVSDNTGDSFWVVLDTDRNLIAQQDMNMFDFEGLPSGLCIICHVSFSGEVTGLVIGEPVDNVMGCVDFSNEISVTRFENDPAYCSAVGSAQSEGGLSFNTITNPVDDQLRLEINSTEKGPHHVIIYDIVGRTLFNNVINVDQESTQVEIEVGELEKGLHFINVTNSTKAAIKTFMKRGF